MRLLESPTSYYLTLQREKGGLKEKGVDEGPSGSLQMAWAWDTGLLSLSSAGGRGQPPRRHSERQQALASP